MGKRYLLPALNGAEDALTDSCFDKIDDIYDFLLNKLKLHYEPNVSVFDGGSNAMPHMFEQMLLFHDAFFDEKDPEHKRAVVEWRAVLAIMALQRIRNLKLETVKVDLSGDSNNPFLKAAASFKPEESPVFYQTTWDFLYILCMAGVPIAIFSPLTVVCPAKMFKRRIQEFNWIQISRINGEEELSFDFRGKGNEYANLGAWLKVLQKNLICNDTADSDVYHSYDKVMKELDKFMEKYSREADLEVETLYKKKIYDSMNNSIRKEYDFLNNCCDFSLDDPKMNFLIERYQNDIFQQKILVIVYDDKPDSMFDKENIPKMEGIFNHVMEIDQREIIEVIEPSGERLAAYALIPFKQSFVSELIENKITAEEFFEEYLVIYDQAKNTLEVRLGIKGFNYSFYKFYQYDEWKLIYGKDFVSTYLWPKERVDTLDWKQYYTYVYKNHSDINIDIPNARSSAVYDPEINGISGEGTFQLICTEDYPQYIKYSSQSVSGYLPIKAEHIGMKDVGGIISVFIDIGHTSTYVTTMKVFDGKSGTASGKNDFSLSGSLRITGERKKDNSVKYNFIMPEEEQSTNNSGYFRNIIQSFYPYKRIPDTYSVHAFEDGQIVFPDDFSYDLLGDTSVDFINFDYDSMSQQQRRHAHIFAEQILFHAVYEALRCHCAYIKLNFLHSYKKEDDEKIGQLEGLWKHALNEVKKRTGISELLTGSINRMSEHNALTYYLFKRMSSCVDPDKDLFSSDSKDVCVSVDIGWKKTLMTHIYAAEETQKNNQKKINRLVAKYASLSYGGYDISMINSEFDFERYGEMLSILMTGSCIIDENSYEGKMVQEFIEIYSKSHKKCENYYQGVFDLIAMQIEKNDFAVPPDVYNRMDEYRGFIKMMTYNILLLFLNIGFTLGKMRKDLDRKEDNIKIYLGGNGAKFLKWISNIKDFQEIREDNQHELFIVGTKGIGIIDIVKKGFGIVRKCNEELSCTIELVPEMKEQMIEGYTYSQIPDVSGNGVIPYLQPEYVENDFYDVHVVDSLASENDSTSPVVAIANQNVNQKNTKNKGGTSPGNNPVGGNGVGNSNNPATGGNGAGNSNNPATGGNAVGNPNNPATGGNGVGNSVTPPTGNTGVLSTSTSNVFAQETVKKISTKSIESPRNVFYKNIQQLRQTLFDDEFNLSESKKQDFQKINDIGKIIQIDTQNVCQNIIHAINNMKSN